MHGNTPYAGLPDGDANLDTDQRRALRRNLAAVTADTRALLPDGFLVGAEITDGNDGPRGTVAVQPPAGAVVSADVSLESPEHPEFVHELAAAAALEVKRSGRPARTAR